MDTQIVTVRIDRTVSEAIAALRRAPRQTLVYLYATDTQGRLVGVLDTRELLLASPRQGSSRKRSSA